MNNRNSYDIIHIRDYYPSKENPASSPWVYDIVTSIQQKGLSSLVVSPTPYIPAFIRKADKYYLYSTPSNRIENYKGTDVIRPLYFKIPKNHLIAFNFYSLSRSIASAIPKDIPPKIIHAHFGQNGVAAVKLKQKLDIPLITSFYGYDAGELGQKYKPFYKKLIRYGDVFLALSEDMKNDLLELGFPEDKILIHHLGIDLDKFEQVEVVKRKRFTFLVVARFDESKGIQDVITAFSKIYNKNMELRIVGDGVYKHDLVKLVSNLSINDNVKFINNFKADDPRKIVLNEMQYCDVALLTSFSLKNKIKEGTPVVLMEAQACAKPCISTFHAGIPEVVINNETGFLVKERDVKSIAAKMKYFFDNPDKAKFFGKNAKKHISNNFNQKKQIGNLYSIYNTFKKS